jgi:hypothetical protein
MNSGPRLYVGIDRDQDGGMTPTGKIIRDAWIFGLLDETETCAGWSAAQIEALWARVSEEWEKHSFLVSALPDPLRERFHRIQEEALARARAAGWDPEHDLEEE